MAERPVRVAASPVAADVEAFLADGAAVPLRPAPEERTSAAASDEDLTKKTQNPVADLISVPFQNNFNFGVGPDNDLQYVLNIQPVWPFKLNEDWNLITRTIVPVMYQPELAPGVGDEFGLGDTCSQASSRRGSRARSSGARAPRSSSRPRPTTRSAWASGASARAWSS